MSDKYILTIDQSTSGSKCLLVDEQGNIKYKVSKSHKQIYPKSGWVEHDPIEIYENVKNIVKELLTLNDINEENIIGLSITNQRETVVVWDKETGVPIYNAIVWQCRRTTEICNELKEYENIVSERTGLRLDPYFSGTKVKWILDNVEGVREKANNDELLLGTIDSWLIWKLTNGKVHATDYTNASRTLLFNIKELKWDNLLLEIFSIPESMMPKIYSSDEIFGETNLDGILNRKLKICGVIGDSQGALFGQCCFKKGMAKSTFGTGNSIMVNIGDKYIPSKNGVVTTIASVSKASGVNYGLEGIVNSSGDTINWIKNELELFKDFNEFNEAIRDERNNNGVYLVPAFVGLGIPYWNPEARASIVGISRDTTKKNIMRAALESIAYQVKDALCVIENESNITIESLSIDGGVTVNPIYNQFLADLLNCKIEKNMNTELSSMGATYLCGLGLGLWNNIEDLIEIQRDKECYKSQINDEERNKLYQGWVNAIRSVLYLTDLNKK
ncbi:FGGY-family carbohydrate kinase [Clostridium baratii]